MPEFMLRSSHSLDLFLAHAHSAFPAEGFGDQTTVQSSLASFYGQWNVPSTVLTNLCLFFIFHIGDMNSNCQDQISEWDRCCALLAQI